MIKIAKTNQIPEPGNLIYLTTKDQKLNDTYFSEHEIDYIQNQFKNKMDIVPVNQFNRMIFVCLHDPKPMAEKNWEEARLKGFELCQRLNKHKLNTITLVDNQQDAKIIYALAEGIALSNYQFLYHISKKEEKKNSLENIFLFSDAISDHDVKLMEASVGGVYYTRDLVNQPLNFMGAVELSEEIKKMGKEAGFTVEVFNKKKIESLKMGGLLAVNKGSIDPPTFSILEYKPKKAVNSSPIVLVGKGVVYDTGGLSLKPTADSMDYMKCDMAGGATVAGVLYAIARAGLNVHVIGLVPATDNRPDGNAYVPGDIITMHSGTTVEVLNTDAEGRMILADALSYAREYKPKLTINIATLTGSAAVAIGNQGLVGMGNADEQSFGNLKKSGHQVHERIAEFPFWDEYAEMLKSDVADMKNIGGKSAGAITAGKFLEHFTDYPFIHLDIAGPAFTKTPDKYRGTGATGIGVRLLFNYLASITED